MTEYDCLNKIFEKYYNSNNKNEPPKYRPPVPLPPSPPVRRHPGDPPMPAIFPSAGVMPPKFPPSSLIKVILENDYLKKE
jgi:hypothetical protein